MGESFSGPLRSCAKVMSYCQACSTLGDSVQGPVADIVDAHCNIGDGPMSVGSLYSGGLAVIERSVQRSFGPGMTLQFVAELDKRRLSALRSSLGARFCYRSVAEALSCYRGSLGVLVFTAPCVHFTRKRRVRNSLGGSSVDLRAAARAAIYEHCSVLQSAVSLWHPRSIVIEQSDGLYTGRSLIH